QRRLLALGAAGVVLAAVAWYFLRTDGGAGPTVARAARGDKSGPDAAIPRIDLPRLDHPLEEVPVGNRDLFGFGGPPPTLEPPPTMAAAPELPTPDPLPTPTPLPPLTVKYMGSVENGKGVKVALFVTDKKEVLAGQVGDTVANRFRVMKIGFESVDVQQVGFDQVQRLPLKPN
ncbi:MAG TPA: hypothetical protein VFQ51_13745, partial [Vicinamibacteria bacterium]|nr:hypothetical protein [Vicinamibacteria bacterium]